MDKQVGKVLNKLIELNLDKNTIIVFVDIYPSLAELCGLPQPTNVDGVSFAPIIKNS